MVWHIVKREFYDNLNSLRFALTIVLLLALMLTNALGHLRDHPKRLQTYRNAVTESLNALTSRSDLYELAQQGPGNLYKKPAALYFCADGGEPFFPNFVDAGRFFTYAEDFKGFWQLAYPDAPLNRKNVRPEVNKVDWAFIIAYVLSLVAILFTFDSISGERERGTLRLMLSNSIPRHTVLIGKFLGAFISISIPFTLAALVNLLVISTSVDIYLSTESWGRLAIMFCIALLYTCLFLALGLLVSARSQRSTVSLVILLLTWVTFVVFIPSTSAAIASRFSKPMSSDQFWEQGSQLHDNLSDEYSSRIWEDESYKTTQARSEYILKDVEQQEQWRETYLTQQIAQIQRARTLTRISPTAILQHLLEAFAGTGLQRHVQFVENTQRYAEEYRRFIVDTDRADPQSLHLIGVREGISKKPVSPEAIPKFEDTLSFSKDFNTAVTELLLLILFALVLLSGAYLAFVSVEV